MVGVSRKSFLAKLIDSPRFGDRLAPAVALTALLRARGADVFRVHEVKENVAPCAYRRQSFGGQDDSSTHRSLVQELAQSVEIILLSVAIYYGYLYFRGTRGAKVLTGLAIVFLTLTLISTLLNLVVIGWIIRSFSVFLAVALVVIFQPELRRGLAALGGHPIFSLTSEKRETVHDLAEAVTQLANKQFGALIAIERDTSIRVYEETGVVMDGEFFCRAYLDHLSSEGRIARWRSDSSQRTNCSCSLHFPCEPAGNVGSQPGIASPRGARDNRGIRCRGCGCVRRDRQHFHLPPAANRAQFYSRDIPSTNRRNLVTQQI